MSERLIIVSAKPSQVDTIRAIADHADILDVQSYAPAEGSELQSVHLLVGIKNRQAVLDRLQSTLEADGDWRITILPVEASLPRVTEETEAGENLWGIPAGESREELYARINQDGKIDRNFLIFAMLAAVVVAIGLIKDNVAVVIGAMVIAPLLGPNLAFTLGAALGDRKLMGRAMLTNVVGVAVSLLICILIGIWWPFDMQSQELLMRTDVGFDGAVLAFAAGVAAAVSITTKLSSALVGVMVAVALLPPTAALGLMIGSGHRELAIGAAMLLAVNVVCLNLAAQLTFAIRGIKPRTWFEKQAARRAVLINASMWALLLVALAILLILRSQDP